MSGSITDLTNDLIASYAKVGGINHLDGGNLPSKFAIASMTTDLLRLLLPGFFDKKPIREPYLIIKDGQLAGMGAHSYSKGSATGGSEEAAKYKKK